MPDTTLETALPEIMRLAGQLKAEAILTIRGSAVTLNVRDQSKGGKFGLVPVARAKEIPMFLGYVEALRLRLEQFAQRPASEFLTRCTPEQRAEVQRLLHRLRCIRRDVLTPDWIQEYEPRFAPSQSSAKTAADAAPDLREVVSV